MLDKTTTMLELMAKLDNIAFKTIGALVDEYKIIAPKNLKSAKGWLGNFIELLLGATAAATAQMDLVELGIELKTIPVNQDYKAIESTYVCTLDSNARMINFHDSWVCKKLSKVLFVPILVDKNKILTEYKILKPFLWQPDLTSFNIIAQDYNEITEIFYSGNGHSLTAKYGTYLHLRPKAANAAQANYYLDHNANQSPLGPKGFYLRTIFTNKLLQQYLTL